MRIVLLLASLTLLLGGSCGGGPGGRCAGLDLSDLQCVPPCPSGLTCTWQGCEDCSQ